MPTTRAAPDGGRPTGAAARVRFWTLALVLLLFVPVGVLAKQAMATLFVVLAVLLVAGLAAERRRLPLPGPLLLVPLGVFLVYAAVGHLLLIDSSDALGRLPQKLAMLVLVLWAAGIAGEASDRLYHDRLGRFLVAGLAIGAVILIVELTFGAPLYQVLARPSDPGELALSRFNRGTAALVLLSWPAGAALWADGRRAAAGAVVLGAVVLATYGESASAALAAAIGVVVFALAYLWGRASLLVMLGAATVLVLAAPWIFVNLIDWMPRYFEILPPSFADRVEIWHHAARAILDGPWHGRGIDVMRQLAIPPEQLARNHFFHKPTTHPHDAALQFWLEFGWPGVLLALALLWSLVPAVLRLERIWRAAAVAALAVALSTSAVSFGFWQETWLGMLGMTAVAIAGLRPR